MGVINSEIVLQRAWELIVVLFLRAIQGQQTPTIRRGVAIGGGPTSRNCSKKLTGILTDRRGVDVTD